MSIHIRHRIRIEDGTLFAPFPFQFVGTNTTWAYVRDEDGNDLLISPETNIAIRATVLARGAPGDLDRLNGGVGD